MPNWFPDGDLVIEISERQFAWPNREEQRYPSIALSLNGSIYRPIISAPVVRQRDYPEYGKRPATIDRIDHHPHGALVPLAGAPPAPRPVRVGQNGAEQHALPGQQRHLRSAERRRSLRCHSLHEPKPCVPGPGRWGNGRLIARQRNGLALWGRLLLVGFVAGFTGRPLNFRSAPCL